jgi:hypothetical protein
MLFSEVKLQVIFEKVKLNSFNFTFSIDVLFQVFA